jgi:single-strand DNA-binding protein
MSGRCLRHRLRSVVRARTCSGGVGTASGAARKRSGREVVMNQVALVGNITDDPELRYTQSGAALAGFTVAVSHRSKHNGEWQDVNDGFFRRTAWRSVAENASRTLRKGMRVIHSPGFRRAIERSALRTGTRPCASCAAPSAAASASARAACRSRGRRTDRAPSPCRCGRRSRSRARTRCSSGSRGGRS